MSYHVNATWHEWNANPNDVMLTWFALNVNPSDIMLGRQDTCMHAWHTFPYIFGMIK